MNPLTSTLVLCVLQVTLFSLATGAIYLVARRLASGAAGAVLAGSLGLVLILTLLAASPWPRWELSLKNSEATNPIAPPTDSVELAERTESNPQPSPPDLLSPYAVAWETFATTLNTPPQRRAAPLETQQSMVSGAAVFWWLFGACLAVSSGRLLWGVWQVRQMVQRCDPIEEEQATAILADLEKRLGQSDKIALAESADIATPATVGWRRPHILLPSSWREWSDDDLRAALAHELSHVAARDYRSWLVARLAVAVHFYHPLIRWLASRLQLEQELAADAAAARLVGDQQDYLTSLASLALATPHHRLAGPARTLFPSRSLLMRRVEMLRTLNNTRPRLGSGRTPRGAVVGLLAIMALAIAGIRHPATSQADEQTIASGAVIVDLKPIERIPLSVVPADAFFAVSIRPAELLASPGYEALIEEVNELTAIKKSGISARDLVEVMLIQSDPRRDAKRMVVRCASADACLAMTNYALRLNNLNVDNTTTVFQTPTQRITRLDERTIVFEPHSRQTPNGEELPPLHSTVNQQWEEAWKQYEQQELVAAISIGALRQAISADERERMARQFPMSSFMPVLDHGTWAVAGIHLHKKLELGALAQCDSEEHAQQIANILQGFIALSSGMVAQQEATAYRQMESQATLEEVAKFRPLMEKMFAIAKDFTTNAKPTADGNRITLAYATDAINTESAALTTQMLLPAVKAARAASLRTQSTNDLRQLSLAMLNYEAANGHLPPAVLYKEGSPHPYSWRVAVLPYLDQVVLYEAYNFDEPWDSEANLRIAETVIPAFHSPFDDPASSNTSYFVLTGPGALFSEKAGPKYREIVDGTSHTLLIVEAKRAVPWTKPEDIPYTADKSLPEFGGWMPGIFLAAFCDGHVETLSQDLDDDTLRALITKAGREMFDYADGRRKVKR